MAFHVRDAETDRVVRELARRRGATLTATIRAAVEKELEIERAGEASRDQRSVRDKIKEIQDRIAARGLTGMKADKAFYDSLYEDE